PGLALDGAPFRALLAKLLEHVVDVRLGDLDPGPRELERREIAQSDLGEHLERRTVAEILVRARHAGQRLDLRAAGRVQLLLLDRLVVGRAHDVGQHLAANLVAVVLAHDLPRNLARAKALQPRRAPDLLQARLDLTLDLRVRHAYRQPAL